MESTQEQTLQDILETVNFIKDNAVTKSEFSDLKKDVTSIQATIVTKDYLDDKLADLRGDLVILMRKEDTKLKTLVEILRERGVIGKVETERIFGMEPFPQLA